MSGIGVVSNWGLIWFNAISTAKKKTRRNVAKNKIRVNNILFTLLRPIYIKAYLLKPIYTRDYQLSRLNNP